MYEGGRTNGHNFEPLVVFTDFAEAEQVQIAFGEAVRHDMTKLALVFLLPQQMLVDAGSEGAHTNLNMNSLRSAAAPQLLAGSKLTSPVPGGHPAAAGQWIPRTVFLRGAVLACMSRYNDNVDDDDDHDDDDDDDDEGVDDDDDDDEDGKYVYER